MHLIAKSSTFSAKCIAHKLTCDFNLTWGSHSQSLVKFSFTSPTCACPQIEFGPRSRVFKHQPRYLEVSLVMGPHWFSNKMLMSQAERGVPFRSKGFAACFSLCLGSQVIWRDWSPVLQASSPGPLSLTAPSLPQPTPLPSFFFFILGDMFALLTNASRVTLGHFCISRSSNIISDNF